MAPVDPYDFMILLRVWAIAFLSWSISFKTKAATGVLAALFGALAIALVATTIILAILGGVGFLDLLLFSPTLPSTCSASCAFTSKDGLDGWVDEACCTYTGAPAALNKTEAFWQFKVNGTSGAASPDAVIHAWIMVNATKHFSAPAGQKPLLLMYNHGSGANIASGYRIARYQYLLEQGNIVIVTYDYAGYGYSTGTATAASVMASANGVAHLMEQYLAPLASLDQLRFAAETTSASSAVLPLGKSLAQPAVVGIRANGAGADMRRLVVLGRSMGGAAAIYSVSRAAQPPAGLLLQSTFATLGRLFSHYYPLGSLVWSRFAAVDFPQFANTAHVAGVDACIYQSHSKDDEWVPLEEAAALQAAASGGRKRPACSDWVVADSALHTQPLTQIERERLRRWLSFPELRP